MKGIITIDNGNTTVKVAYFDGSRHMASNRFRREDILVRPLRKEI